MTRPQWTPKHPLLPPSPATVTEVPVQDDALTSPKRRSRQDDAGASASAPKSDDSCGRDLAEARKPAVVRCRRERRHGGTSRKPRSAEAPLAPRGWPAFPSGRSTRRHRGASRGLPSGTSSAASRRRRRGLRGLLLKPDGFGCRAVTARRRGCRPAWTRRSGPDHTRDRSAEHATRRGTSPVMEKHGPRLAAPVPSRPLPKE